MSFLFIWKSSEVMSSIKMLHLVPWVNQIHLGREGVSDSIQVRQRTTTGNLPYKGSRNFFCVNPKFRLFSEKFLNVKFLSFLNFQKSHLWGPFLSSPRIFVFLRTDLHQFDSLCNTEGTSNLYCYSMAYYWKSNYKFFYP